VLFDLGEVRVTLCELLGREVDVLIGEDVRPGLRARIAPDLVRVF
jgi:predicted nucleotidyltransferase